MLLIRVAPAAVFVLATGCTGELVEPGGAGGGSYGVPGPSGPSVDDKQRETNPSLFTIASKYFPGQAATPGNKRLFRLTRTQLDLTTKTLLPVHFSTSAVAA